MFQNVPTPDQLQGMIEEGTAASAVLSLPTFLRVVDDLTHLHTARILTAPVGAAGLEERERNHALHVALTEIVQELIARRAAGEQAQQELEDYQLHDD